MELLEQNFWQDSNLRVKLMYESVKYDVLRSFVIELYTTSQHHSVKSILQTSLHKKQSEFGFSSSIFYVKNNYNLSRMLNLEKKFWLQKMFEPLYLVKNEHK